MPYAPAVVERTMKVQEVLLQALSGKLTWPQAEEILGWSERTVRRGRRPCFGELLHLDGSRHAWLALVPEVRPTLITVVDDATKRVPLCAAARGRREYRGRHDGPPRCRGSLRAAPGAVHRSRALGRPHPARGRRAGPLEAHAAGPGVAPARDRTHPGLLAGGPRPQRAGQPHAPGPARP